MTEAVRLLAAEKGISVETLLQALADALVSAYKRMPGAAEEAEVEIDADTGRHPHHRLRHRRGGQLGQRARDDTPDDFGRIAAQTVRAGDEPAHPRGRARAQVRGVRRPRGRHRHRHHPAERQPLHAARPRQGRGAAAAGRAGALRAARAQRPPQGLHRRGAAHLQGPPDRREPHPPRPHQAPLRARGPRDRRRRRRDQGVRPRARPPHEDRRVVQRPQRRPRRRLRRRPRRARAHGRQRAAGREDRHRPVLRGPGRLRRQGPVARPR